jgi:hypothetical protein
MTVDLPPSPLPSGTLSAARLQMILGRLASHYYDSPAVQDVIVTRVFRDL